MYPRSFKQSAESGCDHSLDLGVGVEGVGLLHLLLQPPGGGHLPLPEAAVPGEHPAADDDAAEGQV